MSTHTPGPWHISRDRDNTAVHCGDFDFVPAKYIYANAATELEEWQANARLIAAAPTMHDYIAKRAAAGDAEAAQILGGINGNA